MENGNVFSQCVLLVYKQIRDRMLKEAYLYVWQCDVGHDDPQAEPSDLHFTV